MRKHKGGRLVRPQKSIFCCNFLKKYDNIKCNVLVGFILGSSVINEKQKSLIHFACCSLNHGGSRL